MHFYVFRYSILNKISSVLSVLNTSVAFLRFRIKYIDTVLESIPYFNLVCIIYISLSMIHIIFRLLLLAILNISIYDLSKFFNLSISNLPIYYQSQS